MPLLTFRTVKVLPRSVAADLEHDALEDLHPFLLGLEHPDVDLDRGPGLELRQLASSRSPFQER